MNNPLSLIAAFRGIVATCLFAGIVQLTSTYSVAFAVEPAQVTRIQYGVSSTASAATAPTPSAELQVARAQLDDARKFQDQLLATVYWSLGTLATVAALLVGFGWFANMRMYERDKAALAQEMRTQLLEELRKAKEEASSAATTRFALQDKALAERQTAQEKSMQEHLASANAALGKRLDQRIDTATGKLKALHDEIRKLQYDAELNERRSCLGRKIYRNALQASTNALRLAIAVEDEYLIGETLDLVGHDVESIRAAKATPIDNFLVAQVVEALDGVKGSHVLAAASLKQKAAALLHGQV